ncbi:MAG: hypothetical protein MOGDAGHF_01213 [Rhodocyclaceae bacterium]|nr:hypothetical protein [Rhodocyclaceae bacterium]
MVGRLVEQQQVGAAHQRLGEVEAHAPAAGEFRHRAVEILVLEAEAVQQRGGAGAGAVAVDVAVVHVQMRDGLAVVGVLGRAQVGFDLAQLGVAVEREVEGAGGERRRLLADVGDHPVRREFQVARLLVQFAGEEREEARLAAAVGAGDAGLPAGVQAEIDAFEQRPAGAGEGEVAQQDHNSLQDEGSRPGKKALLYACLSERPS